jgi:SnoaL-like domain
LTKDEMIAAWQRHVDAEVRRDYDEMVNTMSEDCYRKNIGFGYHLRGGHSAHRAHYEAWFGAFQSLGGEILGSAFGDDVIVQWMESTQLMKGDYLGIPATNRTASGPLVVIAPFRDGLVEAEIVYFDTLSWCEQLGIPLATMRSAMQRFAARYDQVTPAP